MFRVVAVLLLTIVWIASGTQSLAQEDPARFGIEAIDSEQPFFEVSLFPGESTELSVRFFNHGGTPAEAAIYAANVYTLHGGGMGVRQRDEPTSGATDWLDFPPDTLELVPGEPVERTFTVSVPDDASPGDYIAGIVVQNADPMAIADAEEDQFQQTVRQGIAVAVDVPGPREPGLAITDVDYQVNGERSMILVDIANTGNAHLRPAGPFSFSRIEGDPLAETTIEMDTVYAGTSTRLEIILSGILSEGEYVISLELADPDTGVTASTDELGFVVAAPEADATASPTPAAVATTQRGETPGGMSSAMLLWIVAGVSMLSAVIAVFSVIHLRNRRAAPAVDTPIQPAMYRDHPQSGHAAPFVQMPAELRSGLLAMDARTRGEAMAREAQAFGRAAPKPIRQLVPSRRAR